MKKRKVVLLIILAILLVFLIIAGVFVCKNWNTVTTMYYVFTGQDKVIETQKLDTDKKAEEAIKDYGIETIRPLNEEEAEKLNSGELTEEEAIKIVLGQTDDENNDKSVSGEADNTVNNNEGTSNTYTDNKNNQADAELKKKNDEIASLIGKMYVLKAQFTSDLSAIEDWVNSEYRSLVKDYGGENIPTAEKVKVGKAAYQKALNLESKCDSQVKEILDRVNVLLKETNQNNALVKQIQDAYEKEKMAAKSYYMSQI